MKYYILDLSPQNSLVQVPGRPRATPVFMISWKNPGPEDRDLGMEDYREPGVTWPRSTADLGDRPGRRVHAVGYCLGGTLLAITAAALARDGDERLRTSRCSPTETDFTEPGELGAVPRRDARSPSSRT